MREHLSKRNKWQHTGGGEGKETAVRGVIETMFRDNDTYSVTKDNIKVYPNGRGITPDVLIKNNKTNKIAILEVKRQGKGGNAHERLCRNYMPGLNKALSKHCGYDNPVFTICLNGLAKDKHKKQEIEFWFQGMEDRVFFWMGQESTKALWQYIESTVLPYLK